MARFELFDRIEALDNDLLTSLLKRLTLKCSHVLAKWIVAENANHELIRIEIAEIAWPFGVFGEFHHLNGLVLIFILRDRRLLLAVSLLLFLRLFFFLPERGSAVEQQSAQQQHRKRNRNRVRQVHCQFGKTGQTKVLNIKERREGRF